MTSIDLEALLNTLEQRLIKAEPAPELATKSELAEMKENITSDLSRLLDEKLTKAQELVRHEGTGSKAIISDPMNDDPASYILQKSQSDEPLSQAEKEIAWGLTKAYIAAGMSY